MPAPTALRAPDRLNWIQRTLASPEDKKRRGCSTDTAERLGFKSKPEILPVAKSGESAPRAVVAGDLALPDPFTSSEKSLGVLWNA
jgi:hypothetical protein